MIDIRFPSTPLLVSYTVVVGALNSFRDKGVHIGDDFRGLFLRATRTTRAIAVRPAVRKIFGRSDCEEAAELRHPTANQFHSLAQPAIHFVIAGAERCVVALHCTFELGMRFKKFQRHCSRLIQIEINSDAVLMGAYRELAQVLQSLLVSGAELGLPWKRREL